MKFRTPHVLRGLYLLADTEAFAGRSLRHAIHAGLRAGVRLIQYRDKSSNADRRLAEANMLRELTREFDALLIINDDVNLCVAVQADGVHLGADDTAIEDARRLLHDDCIIGASCYGDIQRAHAAKSAGADYLAFGAAFRSPTKPDAATIPLELLGAARALELPVCAIGGITLENAPAAIAAGADMLAVISDISAADDIKRRCADYLAAMRIG